jgi:hypothetical protein
MSMHVVSILIFLSVAAFCIVVAVGTMSGDA